MHLNRTWKEVLHTLLLCSVGSLEVLVLFSIQLAGAVCGISYFTVLFEDFFIAKLSFIPSRNDLSFAVTPEL